jgi:DNA-binding NarL/FixJ family response regulator
MGRPMKILVIDDHILIREALRGVLKELTSDAVVLEASDCRQSMQLMEQHLDLGLILLDLTLPHRDGFSMLAELRDRYPAVAVAVLSGSTDRGDVIRALDLGALGYIPKTARREVMLSALRLMVSGGMYIPPEILGREELSSRYRAATQTAIDLARSPDELGLTERQTEVLTLLRQGKSNKAIARMLNLAEPTVKNHVTAILKAFKVTNRTEAVIAVDKMRLKLPPISKS